MPMLRPGALRDQRQDYADVKAVTSGVLQDTVRKTTAFVESWLSKHEWPMTYCSVAGP